MPCTSSVVGQIRAHADRVGFLSKIDFIFEALIQRDGGAHKAPSWQKVAFCKATVRLFQPTA
jgi:hypothetical protein